MQRRQIRVLVLIAAIAFGVGGTWLALYALGVVPSPGARQEIFRMSDRLADLECVARACLTPISRNARFVACRRYEFRGARALRSEYAWRKRVQEQPVRPGTLRQDQHTVAVGSLRRRALVDQ